MEHFGERFEGSESGSADSIGLLFDVMLVGSMDLLIVNEEAAWRMSKDEMRDLFHESGTETARALVVIEEDDDRSVERMNDGGAGPLIGVDEYIASLSE